MDDLRLPSDSIVLTSHGGPLIPQGRHGSLSQWTPCAHRVTECVPATLLAATPAPKILARISLPPLFLPLSLPPCFPCHSHDCSGLYCHSGSILQLSLCRPFACHRQPCCLCSFQLEAVNVHRRFNVVQVFRAPRLLSRSESQRLHVAALTYPLDLVSGT